MLLTMLFFVRVFLIPVKRPYVQLSSPGQTERLKGGFKEWAVKPKVFIEPLAKKEKLVWPEVWADRWVGGEGKGGV